MTHSQTKSDDSNSKTHKKISKMTEQQQNCLRSNDSKLPFDTELQTSENEVKRSCSSTVVVHTEPSEHEGEPNQGFWVFGYGSLVWKVDFPVETSLTGYITGYHRRFYQNSIDHRGTVEKPGRVVTLIPGETTSQVYGVAYKIADDRIDEVVKHLDYREKNGYERIITRFNPYSLEQTDETSRLAGIDVCIYLATPDNASFAGPTDMPVLVKQIFEAVGPSGPNSEYVFNLAEAMRRLFPGIVDEHLMEIEKALRLMEKDRS